MHTYRDAKRMAKVLETALRERNVGLSHGESLDIVAKQFGLHDWNTLSARIKRTQAADARRMQVLDRWYFLSEHPTEYDYGVDENALGSGRKAALIRYTGSVPSLLPDIARAHGGLMQEVAAAPFHGKRIELCANLATERVSHGATIWARVDQSPGHSLAFDNLRHHSDGWLFGDNRWSSRRIVLDVPPEGASLHFGFFLKGAGTVWVDSFALSVVSSAVPLTGPLATHGPVEPQYIEPRNLDFSKVLDLNL